MSIEQAQAVNQTVDIKVIIEKNAPIAAPLIILVLVYKYFMFGMNNSMDIFSKIGHFKSTKKTHTFKLFFTVFILVSIILLFWILYRK